MNEQYIRPEDACRRLKVTPGTLRSWSDQGKIECIRTTGGHRRYNVDKFFNLDPKPVQGKVCYARVSSYKQKKDLETQLEALKIKFPDYECIKDIGSGLNFKRKGLCSLLEQILAGTISEIVVTHKDRLCRFGFELFEKMLQRTGGKIVVLYPKNSTPEEELVEDLLTIVTVFSARLYGMRSHSLQREVRRKIKKEKTLQDRKGIQEFKIESISDGE